MQIKFKENYTPIEIEMNLHEDTDFYNLYTLITETRNMLIQEGDYINSGTDYDVVSWIVNSLRDVKRIQDGKFPDLGEKL